LEVKDRIEGKYHQKGFELKMTSHLFQIGVIVEMTTLLFAQSFP